MLLPGGGSSPTTTHFHTPFPSIPDRSLCHDFDPGCVIELKCTSTSCNTDCPTPGSQRPIGPCRPVVALSNLQNPFLHMIPFQALPHVKTPGNCETLKDAMWMRVPGRRRRWERRVVGGKVDDLPLGGAPPIDRVGSRITVQVGGRVVVVRWKLCHGTERASRSRRETPIAAPVVSRRTTKARREL
jgi:hypothetical protein